MDAPGDYVFNLTVFDEGVTTTFSVTVTAIAPTCEEIKADGFKIAADLNGDCSVNLADIAILLEEWLECNDPARAITDPDVCEWIF